MSASNSPLQPRHQETPAMTRRYTSGIKLDANLTISSFLLHPLYA